MASPSGSNPADACVYPADAWYLADPVNAGFPSGFMQCLDNGVMYPKCADCACRQQQSATDGNGTTLNFVECVILSDGQTCSATSCGGGSGSSTNDTIAPAATTAAPAATTPTPTTAAPVATTAAPAATTAAPATTAPTATTATTETTEMPLATVAATGDSASGSASTATTTAPSSNFTPSSSGSDSYNDWSDSSDEGKSVSTGSSSSSSSSKTVLAAIVIGVGVLLVAFLCLWLRSYCKKRATRNDKTFDGVTTATAQRTPAFPPAFGGQDLMRFPPSSGRARATSRTRSNSRTTARSTPRSTPQSTPQSTPIIAPRQTSSSNGSSNVSDDSRSTRSSGGSVFSSSVTNNGAAIFSFNTTRQQTVGGQSRRARNMEPRATRSTASSALSSASRSTDAYSSRRAPPQGQHDIPETKWSVYSEDRDRSTVGRGMSSMISDYSDIDGRSTRFDDRYTNASAMSFFSDDSEFDRETTASERRREREF